mgnify:CR=1 FL=1
MNFDKLSEQPRECYPEETKVGWMTFDTVTLMKSQDPISWQIARDEWAPQRAEEDKYCYF